MPVCLSVSADYYSFHSRIPFGYHTLLNPYSYATGTAIPGLVSCSSHASYSSQIRRITKHMPYGWIKMTSALVNFFEYPSGRMFREIHENNLHCRLMLNDCDC